MFRKLCGDSALKNVVLVTNMWSDVTSKVGEQREKQLSEKFFEPALSLKAEMVRHDDTVQSAHEIIRRIMKNDPAALRVQEELVDEGKDITETEAGEAVNEELSKKIREHEAELKGLREEMAQALREKDEQARQALEEAKRKLQDEIEKIKTDSANMDAKYVAERERGWKPSLRRRREIQRRRGPGQRLNETG